MADVGLDEGDLGAELPKFGFECLPFGLTAARDDQTGAAPGEGPCGGSTDAGQSAGDENDGLAHDYTPVRYDRDV